MRARTAARHVAAALAFALAAPVVRAGAQTADVSSATIFGRGIEVRPHAGGFIPTGALRHVLRDAALLGMQAGWRFHSSVALTGSLAWAPSRARSTSLASSTVAGGREGGLDIWQYDVGIEVRVPITTRSSWLVAPFLGGGAGARTYDHRDRDDVGTQASLLAFGAVGIDVTPSNSPLGARIAVRDNVSAFKGLRGELAEREARNDVQVSAGLTWRF
jgi:hypothetical protein